MYRRLRDLRKDRDMTQKQIANIVGMSQTGYSKYETGENDLPTAVLINLAAYYGVSIDYILGVTDNPKRRKLALYFFLNRFGFIFRFLNLWQYKA